MDICPGLEALVQYRDGRQADADRVRTEKHVGDCDTCRNRIDLLETGPLQTFLPGTFVAGEATGNCPDTEELAAFREGVLPRRHYRLIENHLSLCPPCLRRSGLLFPAAETSWADEAGGEVPAATLEAMHRALTNGSAPAGENPAPGAPEAPDTASPEGE